MANRHMRRCSTLPIIREMHIKTTVRYHLTTVRQAIIKKSPNNEYWQGCGGPITNYWWDGKLAHPLWKTGWTCLKKLSIYSLRYMHPYVHCSIICGGQDVGIIEVSFDRWLDKEDMVQPWLVWFCWLEHHLEDQKVVGSILVQGTYPGCVFNPCLGHMQEGNQ